MARVRQLIHVYAFTSARGKTGAVAPPSHPLCTGRRATCWTNPTGERDARACPRQRLRNGRCKARQVLEGGAEAMSGGGMVALFVLWLMAGALDFHFHRRTDIAHTSGLSESVLHGLQLALIGAGVLAWLAFAPTWGLAAVLGALVMAHAAVTLTPPVQTDGGGSARPSSTSTAFWIWRRGYSSSGSSGGPRRNGPSSGSRPLRPCGQQQCCRPPWSSARPGCTS